MCDAWIHACAASAVAYRFRGSAHIRAAWDARGSGWGSTVTPSGRALTVLRQEGALWKASRPVGR